MKRYELESLLKSFVLFFLLMGALYGTLLYFNYRDRLQEMDRRILSEMKIFSYKPLGGTFQVAFRPKSETGETMRLYRGKEGLYAYFEIPGSRKYRMRVLLPQQAYRQRVQRVKGELWASFPFYLLAMILLALLFSLYALQPFRKALRLNEEFVRDILHDINTPLASMQINLKILKRRYGEDRSVERMEQSLETLRSRQNNLRAFLRRQPLGSERFFLGELLKERCVYFQTIYRKVRYELHLEEEREVLANREALTRIVDNLLDNAGKYNRPGGSVRIELEGLVVRIEDTGLGIRHPQKVFDRYYKEGDRGMGLGLNIVRKLAKELEIAVRIESQEGKGTTVSLDLSQVTVD